MVIIQKKQDFKIQSSQANKNNSRWKIYVVLDSVKSKVLQKCHFENKMNSQSGDTNTQISWIGVEI